jgi:hypothetical protein
MDASEGPWGAIGGRLADLFAPRWAAARVVAKTKVAIRTVLLGIDVIPFKTSVSKLGRGTVLNRTLRIAKKWQALPLRDFCLSYKPIVGNQF